MQWSQLEYRQSDRIGISDFSLFTPSERGWHTCIELNQIVFIVFGGLKYKNNAVPNPFHDNLSIHDVEYLNDVRVYDMENRSWHGVPLSKSGMIDM